MIEKPAASSASADSPQLKEHVALDFLNVPKLFQITEAVQLVLGSSIMELYTIGIVEMTDIVIDILCNSVSVVKHRPPRPRGSRGTYNSRQYDL